MEATATVKPGPVDSPLARIANSGYARAADTGVASLIRKSRSCSWRSERNLSHNIAVAGLCLVGITVAPPANAELIISAIEACSGFSEEASAYHFSSSALFPDYSVKVSDMADFPDVEIKIVNEQQGADFVLIDDLALSNLQVCKSLRSPLTPTIKVSSFISFPDISVSLSTNAVNPDYTLFVASKRFSIEEAAALFAVISRTQGTL